MRQVSELRPDVHLTEATSRGQTLRSVFKEIKAIPGALAQDVRARRRKSESQAKQGAPGKTEGVGCRLRDTDKEIVKMQNANPRGGTCSVLEAGMRLL